jgi:glycosyltransferase involved in cell wall biosynthesis
VFASTSGARFSPVVQSLRRGSNVFVVAGGPACADVLGADELVPSTTYAELVSAVWRRYRTHVLVVGEPVLVPSAFSDRALEFVEADQRVATVSFLSNAAGLVSFPHRATPVPGGTSGHDVESLTRRLRESEPRCGPVPIPIASGGAVLLSSWALGLLDVLVDAPSGSMPGFVAEFSAAATRRGLISVLDAETYIQHSSDLAEPAEQGTISDRDLEWLVGRHRFIGPAIAHERTAPSSPLGLALDTCRAKVLGLHLIIDGSCLGPTEMGTQVGLVALTAALAERDDVADIQVTVPGPVPPYARRLLTDPKIRMHRVRSAEDLAVVDYADVLYRPFHPDPAFRPRELRGVARRVGVGVLDLIAYQIGAYAQSGDSWLAYRADLARAVSEVDAVTTISDDVREMILLERLPIEPSRVVSVPYGTQHLTGAEVLRPPSSLPAAFVVAPFLLCLGTNYSHKNRDVALRAHAELRARGHDVSLVLVGASVPFGSSREAEARASGGGVVSDRVASLPDVPSDERNWLLRHAAVVVYPTSAEGFGLVPFEAAWFGTPTVNVAFGPLHEIAGPLPVEADDWDAGSVADAVERILRDPALAARQVECLVAASAGFTWQRTADRLARLFRTMLWTPART